MESLTDMIRSMGIRLGDFASNNKVNGMVSRGNIDLTKQPIVKNTDKLKAMDKVYGYEIREPNEIENNFFRENKDVAGMATDDNRIILNSFSGLTPENQRSVAENEATRLHMREKGYKFDFPVPQVMQNPFKGSIYSKPENLHHLQSTIISRGVAGDPSAGEMTPAQQIWVNRIKSEMLSRK